MIEDLLRPGLRLVICGTAVGTLSGRLRLYYAGRGNKFWRTLADIGLTPCQLGPEEYKFLLSFGIGLTDIVKGQSGDDSSIEFTQDGSAALRKKISECQPAVLCFNGKRAAKEFFSVHELGYGPCRDAVGNTRLFVAPSTSGAATSSWDIKWWHELARVVKSSVAV